MTTPSISVVMSVYNGQPYLAEAIDSILNQTFRDFEFIIIDDGSTDKTPEILADYSRRDSRMRIIHQQNKGRTPSLNIGIGLAKAKYIERMDADDISLPRRFQHQFDFLEKHPEVGVLGGAVELIDHAGRVFDAVQPPVSDSEIKSIMLTGNALWHPAVIMRRDVALTVGGYRPIFDESEDYDLWLRMGERSRIANLSETILRYRIHANQASVQKRRHQVHCVLAASAAARLRRSGQPDLLSQAKCVTPKLLALLGVKAQQIRRTLTESYTHWILLLRRVEPEAALCCTMQLAQDSFADRRARADAFLMLASSHYRKGERGHAFASAGHALVLNPILFSLVAKRALSEFGQKP